MSLLVIPGRLMGLNEYTALNRAHWAKGSKAKRSETALVAWCAKAQKLKPLAAPCRVSITWYEKNHRRDLDNIAFGAKFILDGLVTAGVLVDDDQKHVVGISHIFATDKDNPRIEVRLIELEAGEDA
ncbi:RusA family crossover junction endodeoxyribonuclease [Olegusella massiliensis]|uniref:RusA family crossover junction endodeoxyribonuclease n=1 Tax=Olegusella massiliensis TaxID=1776381 RepID=UPI0008388C3B|nr:RusA family crossover junction endodeoxyribonuclease [Olegusella massiliensis]